MNDAIRSCPVCRTTHVDRLGPILHPQPAFVAGVELDLVETEFSLRRCANCGFQFKDPPISSEKLLECYEKADSANWELDPDAYQRQFDVIRDMLLEHAPGRRILDVGCFNGALLSYLGNEWQQFGVEPSLSAAELARKRGVNVLAATMDELQPEDGVFDAILAIDVVEHVVEPLEFFAQLRERLTQSGILLILTGNTDALAWRLQGSMYWYCSLPEHVSFYNRSSLEGISREVGLKLVEFRTLSHKRLPPMRKLTDIAKSAAYVVGRRIGGFGVPPLRRVFVDRRGPSIQSAKDHLVAVLQKA